MPAANFFYAFFGFGTTLAVFWPVRDHGIIKNNDKALVNKT